MWFNDVKWDLRKYTDLESVSGSSKYTIQLYNVLLLKLSQLLFIGLWGGGG